MQVPAGLSMYLVGTYHVKTILIPLLAQAAPLFMGHHHDAAATQDHFLKTHTAILTKVSLPLLGQTSSKYRTAPTFHQCALCHKHAISLVVCLVASCVVFLSV